MVQLVKDYARQETLGPLKGAARWISVGAVGALLIGIGSAFLVLGTLRAFQTEFDSFDGRWTSLLPYLLALVVCIVVAVLAASQIKKTTLQKGSKR